MAQKTPNPFDEFDAPAANPFDEFDTAPPAAAKPPRLSAAQEKQLLRLVNNPAVTPQAVSEAVRGFSGITVPPEEVVRVRADARRKGSKVMGLNYVDAPGEATIKTEEPNGGFMEGLGRTAGVVTNALSPYATAAGLGAAAGAPLAGVGAIPGAAGGVLSLGLADLGTTTYNAVAPVFGGSRASLPSETIRRGYQSVGIGKEPVTTGERLLSAGIEGIAGALSGSGAANQFANIARGPTTRRVLTALAQQPRAQAAAGAGSALAGQGAAEMGLGPTAQLAASLAGGMGAGAAATPRPRLITAEQLEARARSAYDRAEQAGVQFDPASISGLGSSIRQAFSTHPRVQFDPALHPRINTALQRIEEIGAAAQQSGTPVSFSQLELMRRIARTASNSLDRDERRLGADIIRQIDAFVQAPPPQALVAGQGPDAAQAITEARAAWRRRSQADALDTIVDKATNSAQGLSAASLRSQARTIANNPNRMRAFDRDIQDDIRSLARGERGLGALQTVGKLAPNLSLRNIPGSALAAGTGGAFYSGSPALGALGIGLGATSVASQAAANRMASGRVASMADRARGTPQRQIPTPQIFAQTAQQAFPDFDPETGAPLLEIGEFEGYPVPHYGIPRR